MIKIANTNVYGWEAAIRGMRNPMNSWDKSDSNFQPCAFGNPAKIGPHDLSLMKNLANAGADHGKFLRFIIVTADVTAPLYWWKEYDTYKIGSVANSCSTMHKIHAKSFEVDDFSHEHLKVHGMRILRATIEVLNEYRYWYVRTKNKDDWYNLIQLLPSSYNQKRTIQLNYQVLRNMYHARKTHKLDEWRGFCEWIKTLPYSELITGATDE